MKHLEVCVCLCLERDALHRACVSSVLVKPAADSKLGMQLELRWEEETPGEQNLLFVFLKAHKVYSAGGTISLISSAEMLKREKKKKRKKKKKKSK